MSKEVLESEKEINKIKNRWECPNCKSNSVALDPIGEHKHFNDDYRTFEILIRCCNCQMVFHFIYKIANVKLHSIKKSEAEPKESKGKKIWISDNKNYIISELENLISDLGDEHYSTPKFFKSLELNIEKWKALWEQEKVMD